MSRLITQPQAHFIADIAVAAQYKEYVASIHRDIERAARQGKFSLVVTVRPEYANKSLELLTHFGGHQFTVSVKNRVLTISW